MRNCFSSQHATQFLISLWNEMDCWNAYSSIHRMFHNSYKCVCVCVQYTSFVCMIHIVLYIRTAILNCFRRFDIAYYEVGGLFARSLFASHPRLSISPFPSRILLVFRFRFLLFSFFYFISFVFPQIHRKPKSKRNARIGAIAVFREGRERHGNGATTELARAQETSKIERLEQTSCMKREKTRK